MPEWRFVKLQVSSLGRRQDGHTRPKPLSKVAPARVAERREVPHNAADRNQNSPIMVHVRRDGWTFLTNHGHVLVCLATNPDVLLRDVAVDIGITERAVQQIVCDLEQAGAIVRMRVGRRNRYLVRRGERFRHPLEAGVTVGAFIDLVERGVDSRRPQYAAGSAAHSKAGRGPLDPTARATECPEPDLHR